VDRFQSTSFLPPFSRSLSSCSNSPEKIVGDILVTALTPACVPLFEYEVFCHPLLFFPVSSPLNQISGCRSRSLSVAIQPAAKNSGRSFAPHSSLPLPRAVFLKYPLLFPLVFFEILESLSRSPVPSFPFYHRVFGSRTQEFAVFYMVALLLMSVPSMKYRPNLPFLVAPPYYLLSLKTFVLAHVPFPLLLI